MFHQFKKMLKMAQWLSKYLIILLLCFSFGATAQMGEVNTEDYKDADQHDRFYKRRKVVSAWQINQLKKGAVVVRLKTNTMAITGLRAQGNSREADLLEAETFVINKNTVYAWRENFNFCKVYFIYSGTSDSLLKGRRTGFFLDTNLQVDPNINLDEAFYVIAERDYAYNSSIGFLPEAQARTIVEKGNPAKTMAFVLKNKYGHQLKNPFPHEVSERSTAAGFVVPVSMSGTPAKINYLVNRNPPEQLERAGGLKSKNASTLTEVAIAKHFTYFKLAQYVSQLDSDLKTYYQRTPEPSADRIPDDVKPFLY